MHSNEVHRRIAKGQGGRVCTNISNTLVGFPGFDTDGQINPESAVAGISECHCGPAASTSEIKYAGVGARNVREREIHVAAEVCVPLCLIVVNSSNFVIGLSIESP
jgi:hypothetical protein